MPIVMYGPAIREAIASNDLSKMKAASKQAREAIKEQGDITLAIIELQEAIDSMEKRGK